MTDNITIKKIPGGYRVVRFKQAGVDAGEVPLATLCGGKQGAALAMAVAQAAAKLNMIDDIFVETDVAGISLPVKREA